MGDGSLQAEIDRMLLSMTADDEVSKRPTQTWNNIEAKKKSRKWNDDVEKTQAPGVV